MAELSVNIKGVKRRMRANAFSVFLYQEIFQRDYEQDIVHIVNNDSESGMVASRMSYLFLCQADNKLERSLRGFEEWLVDIDESDIIGIVGDVITLYANNKYKKVSLKKK